MLQGKTVLLGVSGGIAAYKAVEVASRLVRLGAEVHVLMTQAATRMVAPLTFQAISGQPVRVEVLGEQTLGHVDHVVLSHRADLLIVAPATANTIAALAAGFAGDWITVSALGVRCPVLVCPAMEAEMYEHHITRRNVTALREAGYHVMEPNEGRLASGLVGKGRLPEPSEILEHALSLLMPRRDLAGRQVLVTAGTTREPLDPVRFIGNRSTGKMGYAIAEAAAARGARVTLVSGPSPLQPPPGVSQFVQIETCQQLLEACDAAFSSANVAIFAAAPADYRPAVYHDQKIKKSNAELSLALVKNPDVAATLGSQKRPGQVTVAFAAETQNLVAQARAKLTAKRADFVVANDVSADDAGFGTDTNRVVFVGPESTEELPLMSKLEVAHRILDKAVTLLEP